MVFLNQEAELQKTRLKPEHGQKFLSDLTETQLVMPSATSASPLCAEEHRFLPAIVFFAFFPDMLSFEIPLLHNFYTNMSLLGLNGMLSGKTEPRLCSSIYNSR